MTSGAPGQTASMEETTPAVAFLAGEAAPDEPEVRTVTAGEVVALSLDGEFTETVRRPLVRTLTELLLSGQPLRRVELHLGGITFLNSGGISVLVQLQRMAAPRGIDVALVAPSPAVTRPLQLTGLWHRFPIVDGDGNERAAEVPSRGPDGSPRGRG
jgi:anti-anti-sigma factor